MKCISENNFEIRVLDTYRFMPSSLDTIASNLVIFIPVTRRVKGYTRFVEKYVTQKEAFPIP